MEKFETWGDFLDWYVSENAKKMNLIYEDYHRHAEYMRPVNASDIFNAFTNMPQKIDNCRCVIIGQDPYPKASDAMGMAFSVPNGVKVPRSLKNIYKEMYNEGVISYIPESGDLTPLAQEGVLLLNATLTLDTLHSTNSRHKRLWKGFVECVLEQLSMHDSPVNVLMWGNDARKFSEFVWSLNKLVGRETSHPSPMGGACDKGFFGCGHFRKVNDHLMILGYKPINWNSICNGIC